MFANAGRFLLVPICGLTLTACIPREFIDSLPLTVHVTDQISGKPVPNAVVTYVVRSDPKRRASAITNGEGVVELPEISHTVWVPPLPIDFAIPQADIVVDAAGYRGTRIDAFAVTGGLVDPRCSDVPNCKPLPPDDVITLVPITKKR